MASRLLLLFGGAVTIGMLAIAACSSEAPQVADDGTGLGGGGGSATCTPGMEGCPCETEGSVAECGKLVKQDGNYRTCSVGQATCAGGKWGSCNGSKTYIQTIAGGLQALNLNPLALDAGVLSDPCNPNAAGTVVGDPATVSAPGIALADGGGVSLSPTGGAGTADAGIACTGLKCYVSTCSGGATTNLSGKVYDPAGNNPLYNATVYVPVNATAALPSFGTGASCDTCSGAAPLAAVTTAQTDATGSFTLTGVPSGVDVPIIVQMGKWRREIVIRNVTSCANNSAASMTCVPGISAANCKLRLPKNHTDGWDPAAGTYTKADMPHIALISGSADPFQCMLVKAGIDPNEFGDNNSSARFHYYASPDRPGMILDPSFGVNVSGDTLWNNAAAMAGYDAILLPCEGQAIDKKSNGYNPYQNLINYTNVGGRVFATHYGYVWMQYPSSKAYVTGDNWSNVATWTHSTGTTNTSDPLTATIQTTFPKGIAYSTWLQTVGASPSPNQLELHEGRKDLSAVGPNTQPWMFADHSGVFNPHFTFNTPYSAASASQCGRAVFSDFHVSADAIASSSSCESNADCGFGATCNGAVPGTGGTCNEPCLSKADCADNSYSCSGAALGTCKQRTGCVSGSSSSSTRCDGSCIDPNVTCTSNAQCPSNTTCGGAANAGQGCSRDSDCNGGECTQYSTVQFCTRDSDCRAGTGGDCRSNRCRYNSCVAKCKAVCYCNDDSDCASGATCTLISGQTYGTCSATGNACTTSATCPTGTTCQTVHNASPNTCAANACSIATDTCTNTADVTGAGTCNQAACGAETSCTGASTSVATSTCTNTCGAGTRCNLIIDSSGAGACPAGTCPAGQACFDTSATAAGDCTGNPCLAGSTCVDTSGAAVTGACGAGVCAAGTSCVGAVHTTGAGSCSPNPCGAGTTCTTTSSAAAGGTCAGVTCGVGTSCVDLSQTSTGTCTSNPCAAGYTCVAGAQNNVGAGSCSGVNCAAGTGCSVTSSAAASGNCTGVTCAAGTSCVDLSQAWDADVCATNTCSTGYSCVNNPANTTKNAGVCNNTSGMTTVQCGATASCVDHNDRNGDYVAGTCASGTNACGAGEQCQQGTGFRANQHRCRYVTCESHQCQRHDCEKHSCDNHACQRHDCESYACDSHVCQSHTCQSHDCRHATCDSYTCKSHDCAGGRCAGPGNCYADADCGPTEYCVGGTRGQCSKACTTSAQCTGGEQCVGGLCKGCGNSTQCLSKSYPDSCVGATGAVTGTCSLDSASYFPEGCKQGLLTPQEAALEFMFFDLTACVSTDVYAPPPPPAATYGAASFTQDYTAVCKSGFKPIWRELDWLATIPSSASIMFSGQTGLSFSALTPATPVQIANATTSTSGTAYMAALIDTGTGGTGAFNTHSPPITSSSVFRLTITLNPTNLGLATPTLNAWQVFYDCIPFE